MKKLTLFVALIVISIGNLVAQGSSSSGLTFYNAFGKVPFRCLGYGESVMKAFGPKFVLNLSADFLVGKANVPDTAVGVNSSVVPSTAVVIIKKRIFAFTADLSARYYFVGDAESDMGFYGMAGVGFLGLAAKPISIAPYDQVSYYVPQDDYDPHNLTFLKGFSADFGIGYEKLIARDYFFVNARYRHSLISLTDVGGVGFDAPSALSIEAGFRIPFQQ